MTFFLNLFSEHGVEIILFLCLVVFAVVLINWFKLVIMKKSITDLLETKKRNYKVNKGSREFEEETEESIAIKLDNVRDLENEFNKLSSIHGAAAQAIPIFPMLGILGTVSGLMLQVQAKDIDMMLDSLDTALITTFWGLLVAIVLKVIDIFPAKIINDVEIMLDNFDRKLELAEMGEEQVNDQTGRKNK